MSTVQRCEKAIELPNDEDVFRLRTAGKLLQQGRRYKVIDAFAGAGGFTLGFSEAFGHPFVSVWANDFNDFAVRTYNLNFGEHCNGGDIVDFLADPDNRIPAADVVIGGPPCQGFSLLNKNRKGDPRKQLWRSYLEIVRRSGATVFVMENVPQLLGTEEHEAIEAAAAEMGFTMRHAKLCAADYGVAQTRRRAFLIGCTFADPNEVFPPKKTHFSTKTPRKGPYLIRADCVADAAPWRTVRDVMVDLPEPVGTEIRNEPAPHDLHFGRSPTELSKKRYRAIPEEGMNRFDLQERALELTPACWIRKKSGGTDLFGRMWWDRPSFTIRTEFFKPEKGRYLHPVQHRPITHREAARLQSFPDEFRFAGTKIEIARQIGNAVPPMLAARVADSVYALLLRRG